MAAIAAQTLFNDAGCFSCLGAVGASQTMRIALLLRTLEALGITMTAQQLIDEGTCYLCLPGVSLADTVELALLSEISQNITGGGGAGLVGVVDPEGVVAAEAGTTYVNRATKTFWVKETGAAGTTTFWQQYI